MKFSIKLTCGARMIPPQGVTVQAPTRLWSCGQYSMFPSVAVSKIELPRVLAPLKGASWMPVNEPRIFLDFLQPLRGRDQKFKPCEAQVSLVVITFICQGPSINDIPSWRGSPKRRWSKGDSVNYKLIITDEKSCGCHMWLVPCLTWQQTFTRKKALLPILYEILFSSGPRTEQKRCARTPRRRSAELRSRARSVTTTARQSTTPSRRPRLRTGIFHYF